MRSCVQRHEWSFDEDTLASPNPDLALIPLSSEMNAKMIRDGSHPLGFHGFDAEEKNGSASEEPRRGCV